MATLQRHGTLVDFGTDEDRAELDAALAARRSTSLDLRGPFLDLLGGGHASGGATAAGANRRGAPNDGPPGAAAPTRVSDGSASSDTPVRRQHGTVNHGARAHLDDDDDDDPALS